MDTDAILPGIVTRNGNKILLVVMDGVGGLPHPDTGKTELETATIPRLDDFARRGSCGLSIPIAPGITPGSGPAHIALFGYDPLENQIGRGVLECTGIGMDLEKNDLAIRGNFATIDDDRIVRDRRAGRIPTEENRRLVAALREGISEIRGVKIIIETVKEHRCAIILRGKNLSPRVTENDPQREDAPLEELRPTAEDASLTAQILQEFLQRLEEILQKTGSAANTLLLRGFSRLPNLPSFRDKYGLKAACIATYPMYRGLAKLAGMEILDTGEHLEDEVATLTERYDEYDFFFLHFKKTDSTGEDGNFDGKVKVMEAIDAAVAPIADLGFAAIGITGDHSTPAVMKSHSSHPVPFLIRSALGRSDGVASFGEGACASGLWGVIPGTQLIRIALGYAGKLLKYGA